MLRALEARTFPSLAIFLSLTRLAPVKAVSVREKNAEQTINTTIIHA